MQLLDFVSSYCFYHNILMDLANGDEQIVVTHSCQIGIVDQHSLCLYVCLMAGHSVTFLPKLEDLSIMAVGTFVKRVRCYFSRGYMG